eukprot:gene5815-11116_t
MPGTKLRKIRKYLKYNENAVREALNEIENGSSIIKKSKDKEITFETLRRIQNNRNLIPLHRKHTVLTDVEENAIADWVKECGRRGFGKTHEEVCDAVKQVLKQPMEAHVNRKSSMNQNKISEKMTKFSAAKLKASLSATHPVRIKLALLENRIKCQQLELQLEEMKREIDTKAKPVRNYLGDDLKELFRS